jgi:DNA-directed RNA polymerase specialized sigma24 family protein
VPSGPSLDLDEVAPALASGDTKAFGWWLARAELPLRRSLARFAAQIDVEAVLQESLLRVWQVAPRFRPDGQPNGLLRLARRIASNLALDAVRREALAPTPSEDLDAESIEPSEPDPLLRSAIERCHEALPSQPRAALAARIENGGADPDRTLAEALRMRTNTFLQNVTRARRLLAECLERQGIRLDEVWR